MGKGEDEEERGKGEEEEEERSKGEMRRRGDEDEGRGKGEDEKGRGEMRRRGVSRSGAVGQWRKGSGVVREWSEWRMGGGEAIFDQDIFIVNYTFFSSYPLHFHALLQVWCLCTWTVL